MLFRKREDATPERHVSLSVITTVQGRIKWVNPNFCDVSGFASNEIVGNTFKVVNHPDMPSVIFKIMWQQIRNGEKAKAIIMNQTKDGKPFWVETVIEPRRYESTGYIYGFSAYQRGAKPYAIKRLEPLYSRLIEIQNKESFSASEVYLSHHLAANLTNYQQFMGDLLGDSIYRNPLQRVCSVCSIY